jgi:hypothetical protein
MAVPELAIPPDDESYSPLMPHSGSQEAVAAFCEEVGMREAQIALQNAWREICCNRIQGGTELLKVCDLASHEEVPVLNLTFTMSRSIVMVAATISRWLKSSVAISIQQVVLV